MGIYCTLSFSLEIPGCKFFLITQPQDEHSTKIYPLIKTTELLYITTDERCDLFLFMMKNYGTTLISIQYISALNSNTFLFK